MKLTKKQHGPLIRRCLADGDSYRSIAFELGCDHTTVSKFVRVNYPDIKREPEAAVPPMHGTTALLKLLIIDIETRPNLAYVWGVWNQNIAPRQLIDEKDTISFAAKWLDRPNGPTTEVEFYSIHHYGRAAMVTKAWEMLDHADAVIHYNGKKFDIPHLNLEFLRAGLQPPSPFRQIDLLHTIRREFNFTHNKLDHVADKLGIGRKVEHEGFDLWVKCMADDAEAWERMREYNIGDVQLTEELYYRILPWIQSHPSYAAVLGDARCPNCGSEDLHAAGQQFTKTGRYSRHRCGACGKYCRDTHRQSVAPVTETAAW